MFKGVLFNTKTEFCLIDWRTLFVRLSRNFGSLLVGALIGGILVAAVLISVQWLFPGDMTGASKQDTSSTAWIEQSSSGDQIGVAKAVETGDYSNLLGGARDFEGNSALYQALLRADQEELRKLLEQSKNIPSPNQRLHVQSAIFQRIASLDPQEALRRVENVNWQHRDAILARIFAEWSVSDLDAAVAALDDLDKKQQMVALESILQTRDDLSDSRRQDLARSFKAEKLSDRLMNESHILEIRDDPEAAWNALTSDGFDLVSHIDLATSIAEHWMEQNGFEVLSRVIGSITDNPGYDIFLARLINRVTASNPQGLFDVALGLDESTRADVLSRISYAWSRTDPFAAAKAVIASNQNAYKRVCLEIILRQWANTNPQDLFNKRLLLPRYVQLEGLGYALAEIAKTNPEQALQHLESLEAEWVDISTLSDSLVNGWAETDPHGALEWVTSNSDELGSRFRDLLSDVLLVLVQSNPQEALSIAQSHPVSGRREGIEVRLIRELSRTDLDTAIDLLAQVRDESRQSAFHYVSFTLCRQGQSKRAMELAHDLPESEQEHYLESVFAYWAQFDEEGFFREIENLPNEELRSLAAYHLISEIGDSPVLTQEQLDYAKTLLDEMEIERLRTSQQVREQVRRVIQYRSW